MCMCFHITANQNLSAGLSARAMYGDKTLQTKHNNTTSADSPDDATSQPAKKKIKMQMVCKTGLSLVKTMSNLRAE